MMTRLTITLAQVTCQLHDREANLGRMKEVVKDSPGDVVVFPELNITGYMPRDDVFRYAETMSGPSVKAVAALAKRTRKDILFGLPIREERVHGVIFNSCVLASGDGRVTRYDKMYLPTFGPFEERVFFAPGRKAVVAQGLHARYGLMVCYDMFFPELAKLEALMGAQVLVDLSASPTTSRPNFDKVMPARAVENGAFLAFCNLVGVHGSLVFSGGSAVYGPKGDIIVKAKDLDEDVVHHEIDLTEIEVARRFRPLLKDTRSDVLAEMSLLAAGFGTGRGEDGP
jgi:predicted amidohydrolase